VLAGDVGNRDATLRIVALAARYQRCGAGMI
jgi:hypothetical protein